ncbi:MAG TPA: ribulose-phosphate 3-epimerase [Negativicutes bacterium]|nr:ribulose-phosphate 3-epimerase [Negativicutes bacterium]
MAKIAPSLLSADFVHLAEDIARVEAAGADWLHLDIMDGHFVPNLTFGPPIVAAIRKITKLPLDVHLMVTNPADHIEAFAAAGANWLTVHVETAPHLHRLAEQIRELGVRPAVALNPATPIGTLEEILSVVDMVLVMSVNPGFGGQKFIPSSLSKIRRLKDQIKRMDRSVLIEVDGGVNQGTAPQVRDAGADVLVAGSAVFGNNDLALAIRNLRQ